MAEAELQCCVILSNNGKHREAKTIAENSLLHLHECLVSLEKRGRKLLKQSAKITRKNILTTGKINFEKVLIENSISKINSVLELTYPKNLEQS